MELISDHSCFWLISRRGRPALDLMKVTVQIRGDAHRMKIAGGLHTGEQHWNKEWLDFFDENPGASAEQILSQLEKMVEALE